MLWRMSGALWISVPSRSNTSPLTWRSARSGCSVSACSMISCSLDKAVWRGGVAGECPIHVAHAPSQHFLRVRQHGLPVMRVLRDVVELTRVGLQIEEQLIPIGKMHVFVVMVLNDSQ